MIKTHRELMVEQMVLLAKTMKEISKLYYASRDDETEHDFNSRYPFAEDIDVITVETVAWVDDFVSLSQKPNVL